MKTYSFDLIDVCLPDYLNDHHNRENEVLFGIPVRNNTSTASAKASLVDELLSSCDERIPEELSTQNFRDILNEQFPLTSTWNRALQYIDLAEGDEFEGEECYAYFVLSWDNEEADCDCEGEDQ